MAKEPVENGAPAELGAGSGEAPAAVGVALRGKTAKMPAQVNLEKAVSRLEDRVGGLETWKTGVDGFLADVFPSADVIQKTKSGFEVPKTKGFLDELGEILGVQG
jgi:hypothetical protein